MVLEELTPLHRQDPQLSGPAKCTIPVAVIPPNRTLANIVRSSRFMKAAAYGNRATTVSTNSRCPCSDCYELIPELFIVLWCFHLLLYSHACLHLRCSQTNTSPIECFLCLVYSPLVLYGPSSVASKVCLKCINRSSSSYVSVAGNRLGSVSYADFNRINSTHCSPFWLYDPPIPFQ
jgi:hypothetical protein